MGLWSVLVGVFLLGAATNVVRSTREPSIVGDVMGPAIAIEPDLPISRFIDEVLPLHRQTSFPVAHERKLLGILSLEDLKKIPRDEWRKRRARDVMRNVNSSLFISESAPMETAREVMQRNDVGALAVVADSGELVGYLRPGRVTRKR
jgi:CBS domain-containing protein